MDDLPIDIQGQKLVDWLADRRHIRREWQDEALSIRKQISHAIQDMPENEEIATLLAGSYINYFHCLQIVQILKETEKASKNIFGRYSSQRMKDWQEVVRLYEKDHLYLAECASFLQRNISYEIPALKKQIHKTVQTDEECAGKAEDCERKSREMTDKYRVECGKLGVKGTDLNAEFIQLMQELPSLFQSLIDSILGLKDAVTFYREFVTFVLQRDGAKVDCLPLLRHLLEKGNTTLYEWRTGQKPRSVEATPFDPEIEVRQDASIDTTEAMIDFGVDPQLELPQDIDLDLDLGEGNIDWGNDAESEWTHVTEEDLQETMEQPEIVDIVVEDSGVYVPEDQVARGNDAMNLLENKETRSMVIDDLVELESFMSQRLLEMRQQGDTVLSALVLQNAPVLVQKHSEDVLRGYLSLVTNVLGRFLAPKLSNLLLIRDSPSYLNRVVESLKQKMKTVDNFKRKKITWEQRQVELKRERTEFADKLALIIRRTKELRKQLEEDISKLHKNRTVNIMLGDIESL